MGHRARAAVAACSFASALAVGCSRPARLAADLVITRARVWTGEPQRPDAMAVAVIGDRIVDVGGADDIEHWRGRSTTVVNAEGRRLIPGFNDAHVHFVEGGIDLDSVDLRDADSEAEFVRRIAERAKAKPGEWILGGGWDHRRWSFVNGLDDLGVVDAAQVGRGDPEVGVAELVLDDDEWHAFAGHLNGVGVPELVRCEPPAHTGSLGGGS